jgi:RNase P subunit RPR2
MFHCSYKKELSLIHAMHRGYCGMCNDWLKQSRNPESHCINFEAV